ncbi:MAG: type II toxin-antitoxin system Phd/YefM family antitoxin [Candidatus Tectomicrobia bacterium]|uniref:Antitoxin n=1 Tax=Tectimicrobiota bacterium TaxID=2528274 RepID=A0A932I319_UNCTE|nr:type II toxin-antitoxin system Phd/YefM family antitoxin [Candidatus Tectomicrobia bacterium]
MKKTTFTTVAARNAFSEVINLAAYGKERIALTRRGKTIAYVVPPDDIEALEAIEDRIDAEAARKIVARVAQGKEKTYPLEEVARELGVRLPARKRRKTA